MGRHRVSDVATSVKCRAHGSERLVATAVTAGLLAVMSFVLGSCGASSPARGGDVEVRGSAAGQILAIARACEGHYNRHDECTSEPVDELLALCRRWQPPDVDATVSSDVTAPARMVGGQRVLGARDVVFGPSTDPDGGALTIWCGHSRRNIDSSVASAWQVTVSLPNAQHWLPASSLCDGAAKSTSCAPSVGGGEALVVHHFLGVGDEAEYRSSRVDVSVSLSNYASHGPDDVIPLRSQVLQTLGIHLPTSGYAGPAPAVPSTAPVSSIAPSPQRTTTSEPAPSVGQILPVPGLDGRTYNLQVWAADRITSCADHAYGDTVVKFLHAHRCSSAHRLLAIVKVDGRLAVLSVATITFAPAPGDRYGYNAAMRFQELENSPGTGSMDDLLREHHSIPGVAIAIPSHEAFYVTGQDAGVAIFDLWWEQGTTRDQDPRLVALARALFPTQATPFD